MREKSLKFQNLKLNISSKIALYLFLLNVNPYNSSCGTSHSTTASSVKSTYIICLIYSFSLFLVITSLGQSIQEWTKLNFWKTAFKKLK